MVLLAVAVTAFLTGTATGIWLCLRTHGLRRCPTCRCHSELYADHLGHQQCGWCWLRATGQDAHLLGTRIPHR